MGVIQLEPNLTAGKALERVRWVCCVQLDQVAELKDILKFALAGVCAGGRVS
jgi:hypothetical protein